MKSLHHAMMGIALVAVLAVSLGFGHPFAPVAEAQHGHGEATTEAQHGHGMAVEEQFDAFSAALELTADQKEAIADPFHEGLGALQNLQRLHDMILAELSEEQQHQYVELVHGMIGASFSAEGHGH